MSILIFDKSAEFTERLMELIHQSGAEKTLYHIYLYNEALDILKKRNIKLVILGLSFGEILPLDFFNSIKILNKEIKTIILYTWAEEKTLQLCKENGADYIFNRYNEFESIPKAIELLSKEAHEN